MLCHRKDDEQNKRRRYTLLSSRGYFQKFIFSIVLLFLLFFWFKSILKPLQTKYLYPSNASAPRLDIPTAQIDIKSNVVHSMVTSEHLDLSKNMTAELERLYRIGVSNAAELVRILEEENPFEIPSDPSNFSCSLRDYFNLDFQLGYDLQRLEEFRNEKPGSFIFYQHLRYGKMIILFSLFKVTSYLQQKGWRHCFLR